jgi:hypothetical protein
MDVKSFLIPWAVGMRGAIALKTDEMERLSAASNYINSIEPEVPDWVRKPHTDSPIGDDNGVTAMREATAQQYEKTKASLGIVQDVFKSSVPLIMEQVDALIIMKSHACLEDSNGVKAL